MAVLKRKRNMAASKSKNNACLRIALVISLATSAVFMIRFTVTDMHRFQTSLTASFDAVPTILNSNRQSFTATSLAAYSTPPQEVLEVVREGAKEFHTPVCSREQLELHKKKFDPAITGDRFHTPIKLETACPKDSAYLAEYFGKMNSTKFLAVNIGCNKGLDAVAIAGLLSQNRKYSTNSWKESLGDIFVAVCGMPELHYYDGIPEREGRVFCVEPVPQTFEAIAASLDAHESYKDTLVLTQAAISNASGTVLFPDVSAGQEARSMADCYMEVKPKEVDTCVEVPMYTVDTYLKENQVDLSPNGDTIDLLLIDVEGFDWEVLQGSSEAIQRTRYLMFEVHMNGNWMKHSLLDTLDTNLKDFNCYWVGQNRLWRITNCIDDDTLREIYELKSWSNVGCVRRTEVELAQRMETIFLQTQLAYNTSINALATNHHLRASERTMTAEAVRVAETITELDIPKDTCVWTELAEIAEDEEDYAKRVIVTSSHGTSEGTSYIVVGNTSRISCGEQRPLRDIILADPKQNNNFNLHRIDCPRGVPLRAGSQGCPALEHGQHPGKVTSRGKKHVLCLAPLYEANTYGRYLIEWIVYHHTLGFDHIVIPDVDTSGEIRLFLKELENMGMVRLVPWSNEESKGWLQGSHMYEHGKLPAWNRCYLEYQEMAEWMLFIDIDELLGVKTNLQETIEWMNRIQDETKQVGFSIKSRSVLSVLDHEIDNDLLLLEQFNTVEKKQRCPYNCGEFHLGRWKYFIKGHGGRQSGAAAAPIPELLWTHSIQGLNYTRAKELMGLIPADSVAELRHYQAHWYIYDFLNNNLPPSEFQSMYSSLPRPLLKATKNLLQQPFFDKHYKAATTGLAWGLHNNEHKPLPQEVLEVVREGAKEFHTPVCSREQLELHKKKFDPAITGDRFNTPIKLETACPKDSAYLAEYFGKMKSTKFLAVNIGCNKGLDAVAIAGLLSQNRKYSTNSWKESLGDIFAAICGMPELYYYDGIPEREGRVFCVEPVPQTFEAITASLDAHESYKDTLVLTQAAISNASGTVLFPDVSAGQEARSMADCYMEVKPKEVDTCVEVPMYTVDTYLKANQVDLSPNGDTIDLLLIDVEGFDWEVLQGSSEAIQRTRYLMFEVHMNGNWMKHSLLDTLDTNLKDFNCYWVGQNRLWRITNCIDDDTLREIYELKSWSNVGCVRRTEVELAQRMETIFLQTQLAYNTSIYSN